MRILGIDPGSNITGWGVIDVRGNKSFHVDNGCIFARKNATSFTDRLYFIHTQLNLLIKEYAPTDAAIENVFMGKNANSALKLGQARGSAIISLKQAGLPIFEYTPTQVKSAVVGYGRAGKKQIAEMVRVLLNLPECAYEDASDSLAVAICHAHSHRFSVKSYQAVSGKTYDYKKY